MKYIGFTLYLILISISHNAIYAQISSTDIIGEWVTVKDSTKKENEAITNGYRRFIFTDSNMMIATTPIYYNDVAINIKYTLRDSIIVTSLYKYKITHITKDSLYLAVINDSSSQYYSLIKKEFAIKMAIIEKGSPDTFIVDKYTAPKLDSNRIYFHRFGRYINDVDLHISGHLYFNVKDNSLKCIIDSSNQKEKTNKLIIKALEVPKSYWNLTGFEACKYVGVPFYLITSLSSHIEPYNGNTHIAVHGQDKRGELYFLDTPLVAAKNIFKNGDYYPTQSLKIYKKGVTAFETHDTAKALKYFNRAYDLNKNNINAGYNYAVLLYQTGQKDEACKIMTELKDTDDKGCKEFYEKYCQ